MRKFDYSAFPGAGGTIPPAWDEPGSPRISGSGESAWSQNRRACGSAKPATDLQSIDPMSCKNLQDVF